METKGCKMQLRMEEKVKRQVDDTKFAVVKLKWHGRDRGNKDHWRRPLFCGSHKISSIMMISCRCKCALPSASCFTSRDCLPLGKIFLTVVQMRRLFTSWAAKSMLLYHKKGTISSTWCWKLTKMAASVTQQGCGQSTGRTKLSSQMNLFCLKKTCTT